MYGTQAVELASEQAVAFENDVNMYGTQAVCWDGRTGYSLRMM